MTNSNTNTNEPTYTATFTLRQEGKDGDVHCSVRMDPPATAEDDIIVYDHIVAIAYSYLRHHGMIDENNNFIGADTDGGLAPTSTTKQ